MNAAILEKIRKLLALSKSDNANEAAVAAAAAQRLMTEHQIAEAELGGSADDERAQREIDPLFTGSSEMPMWLNILSFNLAQLNGCITWIGRDANRRKVITIVGRPSDVASVRYLFAWLRLEIDRLTRRHAHGKGRTYATSYRKGCVSGVVAAMRETTKVARQQASGAALVKLDARLIDAAALAPAGMANGKNIGIRADRDAYERGQAAGRRIHTGSSLGAGGARLLGTGS